MEDVLTPREAAEYLKVHVRTIYRLVKNSEIPGRKVGGSWRFKREDLEEWLSIRENPQMDLPLREKSNKRKMRL
jgi:excisionase family DNA binding protein